ncbi:hypothetical protein AWL63_23895 (plasmid) [Sphingomonas panacis]|uniref:Enoyl-CoA hydratase n=1 Tax=Sphingomonas panacis TaxID=1560345 RepID=A0A1B3ZIG3_9SPHN|nr:enoyl-CoA hydratase [Sphingomonas panacis]AOH87207.1 hypothetical protein AWL63_23895 [Sphingomonas panacis]
MSQVRAVRTITISRPEKKNALTRVIYDDLAAAIRSADDDRSVRVICITGAQGAFTSGNDVTDFEANPPTVGGEIGPGALFAALRHVEKPVVAAVNGIAVGIGTTLLLHCDLVYAAASARFKLPFVGLGLVPEGGSTGLLPRLLGMRRASELLFFGDWIDAQKALSWGLVNDIFEDAELLAAVQSRADRLACQPGRLLRLTKRLMKQSPVSLDQRIDEELELVAQNIPQPEAQEALLALRQKRAPDFEQFEA